jgi:tripartite-type tricarboxylate transporter receptor subunit TctC
VNDLRGSRTQSISRRQLLAAGLSAGVLPRLARADDFPSKPIRLMVGFAAGGGVDIAARIVAPRLADDLKGTVVVDNKAGASGMICSEYVAKSPADGYTLMFTGGSAVAIAPQLVAKPSINSLTELMPVNTIGASPLVISLHPSLGIRTLQDFLAAARSRSLTLGSAGNGTLTHLTIEMLSQLTGGKIVHVPYKGGGPAVIDGIAGHVDGIVTDIPPVQQHFREGRLIPVAVTSERPIDLLPGVSPANVALPGFTATSWFGIFAPAGTPAAIVDRLSASLAKVAARDDVVAQLKAGGVIPYSYPNPEQFRRFVAEEYSRWGKLVRERHISAAS